MSTRRRKTAKAVSKALSSYVKGQVKRELAKNIEDKETLYNQMLTDCTYTPTLANTQLVCLSAFGQGAGTGQHIGDKIQPTLWEFNYHLQVNYGVGVTDYTNTCRVILFQYMADDTIAAPLMADLLQAGISTVNSVLSPFIDHKKPIVHILYDQIVNLEYYGNSNASKRIRIGRKKLLPIYFKTGLTTGVNNMYFCIFSDSSVSLHPQFSVVSKIHWEDA